MQKKTEEDTKTLKFNQYQNSDKAPFIIYADLEYLIEKIDGCKNDPDNSSTTNVGEYILSGYSMSTIFKKFYESLRQHAMEVINFLNEIKLLTKEQQESYKNAKICFICKEKLENKYLKDKKYRKAIDHFHYTGKHRGAAHSIYNLKYRAPKKIPIAIHNGSNHDYHFIIKELGEELWRRNYKNYIMQITIL